MEIAPQASVPSFRSGTPSALPRGRRLSGLVLLALMVPLHGCFVLVGEAFVEAPNRLAPTKKLPPLEHPIRFDVCASRMGRTALAERVRRVLMREGIPVELTPSEGLPAGFTVTEDGDSDPMAPLADGLMVLSFLTDSVVPTYLVERTTLKVHFGFRDASHVAKHEQLEYRSRMTMVFWLPFVVYPDAIVTLDGGWESAKAKDGGLERLIERLGDDLRARLGAHTAVLDEGDGGVSCPKAASPTPGLGSSPQATVSVDSRSQAR